MVVTRFENIFEVDKMRRIIVLPDPYKYFAQLHLSVCRGQRTVTFKNLPIQHNFKLNTVFASLV